MSSQNRYSHLVGRTVRIATNTPGSDRETNHKYLGDLNGAVGTIHWVEPPLIGFRDVIYSLWSQDAADLEVVSTFEGHGGIRALIPLLSDDFENWPPMAGITELIRLVFRLGVKVYTEQPADASTALQEPKSRLAWVCNQLLPTKYCVGQCFESKIHEVLSKCLRKSEHIENDQVEALRGILLETLDRIPLRK